MSVYAGLHIDGPDLVPDDATRAIGLKPDATYPREQRLPSGRLRGHGSWYLHTGGTPRTKVEDAIDDLFSAVAAGWPQLVRLSRIHAASICVVIKVEPGDERYPQMHLRRDQIEKVSELGASIDFDDYDEREPAGQPRDIQ